MIPVNPPAASDSSKTAGNQSRRRSDRRSAGGALTIAIGEKERSVTGVLVAIID
jgi:hypothetical protein